MKKIVLVLCLLLSLVGCGSSNSTSKRVGVIQLEDHPALNAATKGFVDVVDGEFGKGTVDVKLASGDSSTCNILANEFVADNVDLIMCNATPALISASKATENIPILGTSVTEYGVALGIDGFNGTVGGNISGTSDLAPLDQQAQMFIDLLPNAKKIGILYCSSEPNSLYQVEEVTKYLKNNGLEVIAYSFSETAELSITMGELFPQIDALYIPTDNACAKNVDAIRDKLTDFNIPVICGEKSVLDNCNGLATLSIDYYELGKTTGEMAVKILKGEADISSMPIEYFKNPERLFIKEVADKFGVIIPDGFKESER